ncbi:MAG: hypothetical protein HQL15_04910 [Candidatus Omnitrophica bacterium]|nr:hypothetical protein [Candidatus Omnitrophota bacterium]
MIQQICLSRNKTQYEVNLDQPIELVIKVEDYARFKDIIKLLFDKDSIKRIKKVKSALI